MKLAVFFRVAPHGGAMRREVQALKHRRELVCLLRGNAGSRQAGGETLQDLPYFQDLGEFPFRETSDVDASVGDPFYNPLLSQAFQGVPDRGPTHAHLAGEAIYRDAMARQQPSALDEASELSVDLVIEVFTFDD